MKISAGCYCGPIDASGLIEESGVSYEDIEEIYVQTCKAIVCIKLRSGEVRVIHEKESKDYSELLWVPDGLK